MKYKLKSELDLMGTALNVLCLTIGFGIVGLILNYGLRFIFRSFTLSSWFIVFYSIFTFIFLIIHIIKIVISTTIIEKIEEK
ncbi:hypothetical protein [Fusobacterium sp.]|uniref:hypothetical protein n=1 Tax=Fusobacterium sp. TaxID=68766 RepID=UPI0029050C41|nr:hypothetical protein [Fusobacterium sp.]MDU1912389.1 hypothetical protein [Fusobacterium sp.]